MTTSAEGSDATNAEFLASAVARKRAELATAFVADLLANPDDVAAVARTHGSRWADEFGDTPVTQLEINAILSQAVGQLLTVIAGMRQLSPHADQLARDLSAGTVDVDQFIQDMRDNGLL